MKLATDARSKKPSTALRMRSCGSILERSIVGEGGFFFDFFPRCLLLVLTMMVVIDSLGLDQMNVPERQRRMWKVQS
jgi:hypothetical protein